MIKKYTKEQFFEEFVLHKEDLDKLEDATGILPARAREIWKIVSKAGNVGLFDVIMPKSYIQAIYDLGLEPEDEEERKSCPDIYLGLDPVEKVYAGYLLGLEQTMEQRLSKEGTLNMTICPNCGKDNIVRCHGGTKKLKVSGIEFLCQDCHCEF